MSHSLSPHLWRSLTLCLLRCPLLRRLYLLLIGDILSLLLLQLARLPACILAASRRVRRVALLLARCICLLSCFAIPLIFQLELLGLGVFRNWRHAQSLSQVSSKRRRHWRGAHHHLRIVKLPGNARRQIDLAATPRGI
jgi:hypothetical protein